MKWNIETDKWIVEAGEEWAGAAGEDKCWAWRIPCYSESGPQAHIWDYSDTHLGFYSGTEPNPTIKRRLKRLEYVEIAGEGDAEYCCRFPRAYLDAVGLVVGARFTAQGFRAFQDGLE